MDPVRAAELRTQLSEVRAAIHALMVQGNAVRRVRRGDREIEYTQANLPALQAYELRLSQELRIAEGRPDTGIGVHFG